ncbi:MAG: DinB family protein [Burkholderiales bacterium]
MLVLTPTVPVRAEITPQDRARLVQYLTTTRDQVLAESAGLSETQWNFKPGPDRWSVGEVVEHLALAETFIFDLQQKTVSGTPATPEQQAAAKGKDEMILKVIPDRTKKAQAPEPIQPAKRLGSQATVLAAFKERREKTLEYAGKTTDDLRARVADSPLGSLDGYQWLLFMGAHAERHLAQIKEVKADAKFPKSSAP